MLDSMDLLEEPDDGAEEESLEEEEWCEEGVGAGMMCLVCLECLCLQLVGKTASRLRSWFGFGGFRLFWEWLRNWLGGWLWD
jgi:hypothetical protein